MSIMNATETTTQAPARCPNCDRTLEHRRYLRDEYLPHYVCWSCYERFRADNIPGPSVPLNRRPDFDPLFVPTVWPQPQENGHAHGYVAATRQTRRCAASTTSRRWRNTCERA